MESIFEVNKFLENYSLPQKKIITDESSIKQVIAAAGSGKTRTVSGLVRYRLLTGKYPPGKILTLSFSRKAAAEIRERIPDKAGNAIEISTFHAFAFRWISKIHPEFSKNKIRILTEEKKRRFYEAFFRKHAALIGGIPFQFLISDRSLFQDLFPALMSSSHEL